MFGHRLSQLTRALNDEVTQRGRSSNRTPYLNEPGLNLTINNNYSRSPSRARSPAHFIICSICGTGFSSRRRFNRHDCHDPDDGERYSIVSERSRSRGRRHIPHQHQHQQQGGWNDPTPPQAGQHEEIEMLRAQIIGLRDELHEFRREFEEYKKSRTPTSTKLVRKGPEPETDSGIESSPQTPQSQGAASGPSTTDDANDGSESLGNDKQDNDVNEWAGGRNEPDDEASRW
ncbi:uncharacterized protein F4822DRAFT_196102 [Hypoxylon trugodes]|uniref:uncharacterized protein n=1 Tax=Hypoxylon trugodes TaxID=326681 RepID=UPI00219091F3|nr:uncharacterized protein F4822DRAFT_196102 [Hypoxylon trugodes]KAI1389301.1 hypothetical protein F4822DRAFT_196102 [Hypoxylon trugodes]